MAKFDECSAEQKKQLWAILALRHASGIGARRAQKLLSKYGTALEAVEAGMRYTSEWRALTGISEAKMKEFTAGTWRDAAKAEWHALQSSRIQFISWDAPAYPDSLRGIPDPPLLIYYAGDVRLLRGAAIAVVGSRDCTRDGLTVASFFARDLSRAGVIIVSGMAKGIDRAAHLAGMDGPGGSLAVLGTGIDVIYPRCNADLHAILAEKGLLITEYAPRTKVTAAHFSVRNRLISGLCQGVLVVEAASRSGSLITARLALEQNRDVFAVPGHAMAATSEGCRELIRNGARPVFCADDILCDLAPLLTAEARKAFEQRRREDAITIRYMTDSTLDHPAHAPIQPETAPVFPKEKPAAKLPCKNDTCSIRKEHPTQATSPLNDEATISPLERLPPSLRGNDHVNVILTALEGRTLHIDALARELSIDIAKLSALLLQLEIAHCVCLSPGMLYSLNKA